MRCFDIAHSMNENMRYSEYKYDVFDPSDRLIANRDSHYAASYFIVTSESAPSYTSGNPSFEQSYCNVLHIDAS